MNVSYTHLHSFSQIIFVPFILLTPSRKVYNSASKKETFCLYSQSADLLEGNKTFIHPVSIFVIFFLWNMYLASSNDAWNGPENGWSNC